MRERNIVHRRWLQVSFDDTINDAPVYARPTTNLNHAIGVARDLGRPVLCSKGVFTLYDTLEIDVDVEIYGQPGTIWRCEGTAALTGLVDVSAAVRLDGIQFESNNANLTYLVRLNSGADGSKVIGCTFTQDANHIYIDAKNNIIKDNFCVSTAATPVLIYLEDTADLNHVAGNNLSNSNTTYPDHCGKISVKTGTQDERFLLGWSGVALLSADNGPNWAQVEVRP